VKWQRWSWTNSNIAFSSNLARGQRFVISLQYAGAIIMADLNLIAAHPILFRISLAQIFMTELKKSIQLIG
jgi:hypothetical protein